MPKITEIEDLRQMYKRRTPRMFYDYCEAGSWTQSTTRANEADFDLIHLRQRIARDMAGRSLRTTLLGEDVSMPVALAPVGLTGMQAADGEIKAARAAEKAGVPFTLSTMSICSIEDVAEHTEKPFWFQVYTLKDDDFMRRLIGRAKAAGCSALVITVDLQIMGQRHADIRNGLSAPPKMTPAAVADMMTRLPWGLEMLRTKRRFFGNIVGHAKGVTDPSSLSSWTAEAFDPSLDWDRIREIMDWWGGPVILKGILDPEDAEKAVEVGAQAIVVSNHGGRQLDGALSSIRMLPTIVDAVGDRIEVMMDGGVRSGQDVLRAVALGARGVMIGRAFVYGLGAMGQRGVEVALEVIRKELDTTMALCGERDIHDVGPHNLLVPKGFVGEWEEIRPRPSSRPAPRPVPPAAEEAGARRA